MSVTADDMIAAIFQQESGSGKADTSKVNSSNVTGPMQVQEGTFNGLKKNGLIPADYDWKNPAHNKAAGDAHVRDLFQKYGGDPGKVAAAYYAGEKAVNKDGSINDFKDLKNPGNPTTFQYRDKVLSRLGVTAAAPLTAVGPGMSLTSAGQFDTPLDHARDKPVKSKSFDSEGNPVVLTAMEETGVLRAGLANGPAGSLGARHDPDAAALLGSEHPAPGAPMSAFDLAQPASDAAIAAQAEKDAVSYRDMIGASSLSVNSIGAMVRRQAWDDRGPAIPGFRPTDEQMAGKTEEDRDELLAAINPRDLDRVMAEQFDRDERAKIGASKGLLAGFATGAVATLGDPLSYLLPYAAARNLKTFLGIGSAALAAQGRGFAAGASAFAENALTNVAQDHLIAAAVNEHRSWGDEAASVAMAGLPGILHAASGWHAGHRQELARNVTKYAESVVKKEEEYARQAIKNLGNEATPDQIRAEMDRLQTAAVKNTAEANVTTALPQDRQLLPAQVDEANAYAVKPAIEAVEGKELPAGGAKTSSANDGVNVEPTPLFGRDRNDRSELDIELGIDRKRTNEELDKLPKNATAKQKADAVRYVDEMPVWDQYGDSFDANRLRIFRDGRGAERLVGIEGLRLRNLEKQPPGFFHAMPLLAANARLKPAVDAVRSLGAQFLKNSRIAMGIHKVPFKETAAGQIAAKKGKLLASEAEVRTNPDHDAAVWSMADNHVIALRDNLPTHEAVTAAIHEVGHAIFHEFARKIPKDLLARMVAEHAEFLKDIRAGKASARYKRHSIGSESVLKDLGDGALTEGGPITRTNYAESFDEYTAEAFVRYIQKKAANGDGPEIPPTVLEQLAKIWNRVKAMYLQAMKKGYLPKDEAFEEFFDRVLKGTLENVERDGEFLDEALTLPSLSQKTPPNLGALNPLPDVQVRNGLDTLPEDTPFAKGEKQAITFLYQRAEAWAKANPKDAAWDARASSLNDNNVFNVASTGLLMLKSNNPVVRMIAAELLEDAGGVVGHRNSTAAISKHFHERLFMGNTVNDLQSSYDIWKKDAGGSLYSDLFDGKNKETFDRLTASEIESRRQNGGRTTGTAHPAVIRAADTVEKAYERMRLAQINNKTLGWAALPESSKGYMPHKMSSTKVRELTNEQRGILNSTLVDQFITIEGWDMTFAQNLAGKYIDRIQQKALGAYDAPMGIHQTGASDVVEDALTAMGLSRQEVHAQMGRYIAAGPGHTKKRLKLDLNQEHTTADGKTFRLLDLFDTDQLRLVRSQAQRVSGEVALARHGVVGKPGLAVLRRAMGYGADGERALPRELEAFDQVSAEFLGEPFGTQEGKWMERARMANSAARLGGIVFNQFAEFINGAAHIGVGRTLSAMTGIHRLRAEIIALSKGQKVDNPMLTSIEHMTGAEFGTDAYKLAFPFDAPDHAYPTYGRDTITATDRLLRGAGHVQSKISFWRAMHSAQQRGMAEQIVQKAVQFIKSGADDAALNDMGIHPGLRARLQADIDHMATFDSSGKLTSFDLMKARDGAAANDFAQAVSRGVSQIIQGNFIGEQGKWAHSGYLKMLTQFRSFSILSVEKQWARQRNNQGTAKALGILVGSMSIAVPVYMARVYAQSIGRKDREEFLEKNLSPFMLTRATLNYVALSGLSGDFLDALTAIAPDAVQEKIGGPTGGRSGTTKSAVGNLIAPAAGYVDDVWGALQNLDKPEKAAKILPFSRIPYLIPAVNALGDN